MFATAGLTSELEPSALLVPIRRPAQRREEYRLRHPRRRTLRGTHGDTRAAIEDNCTGAERAVRRRPRRHSGQFMLDSESQLREAIQKMAEPARRRDRKHLLPPRRIDAHLDGNVHHVCLPMPEHVSIEYQHSGKCPLCGMALVPATPDCWPA